MSDAKQSQTHFSGDDEMRELDDYRPISSLVVSACLVSMLSVVSIVHPILWIIPVVAAVLAIAALTKVTTSGSKHGGRLAAIFALCFATLVGTYAPAKSISHDRKLCAGANASIEKWVSLLRDGRVLEAHQLTKSSAERFSGPGTLADYYTGKIKKPGEELAEGDIMDGLGPPEELHQFKQEEAITKILSYEGPVEIEYVRNSAIGSIHSSYQVWQDIKVNGIVDGAYQSTAFNIQTIRHLDDGNANWRIGRVDIVKK